VSFRVRASTALAITIGKGCNVANQIGDCFALSTPCVPGDGCIYYQGTDFYLHQFDLSAQQDTAFTAFGQNLNSSPWVFAGYAYCQGVEPKLWQIKIPYLDIPFTINPINIGNNWIGAGSTHSVPCVTDEEFIFFRGSDNKLLAVQIDDPAIPVWLGSGGIYTSTDPWAPGDGFVYFAYYNPTGSSEPYSTGQLLKLELATQEVTAFDGLYTQSTPCVPGDGYMYFPYQSDSSSGSYLANQLLRADLTTGDVTGFPVGNAFFLAASSPAVPGDGYMYFQGTDSKLWMVGTASSSTDYEWVGSDSSGNNGYYTLAAPCAPPGEGVVYFVQSDTHALMQELVWEDYPQPATAPEVLAGWADAPLRYSPANWMHALKSAPGSTFGAKSLSEVVIPGSHDAGMYESTDPTGNSVTQNGTIYAQLLSGSRYFDLRIRYWDWWFVDGFVVYHNWAAAEGPSLTTVAKDVARFMASTGADETVVLKFGGGWPNFDSDTYARFVSELLGRIGAYVYKGLPANTRLAQVPLNQLGGKVIVVSTSQYNNDAYRAQGIYTYADAASEAPNGAPASTEADLVVFDKYSDSDSLTTMANSQIAKFAAYTGQGCDLFLLSWTLTPLFPVPCSLASIPALWYLSDYYPGHFTNTHGQIINIVYVDFVNLSSATRLSWNTNAAAVASEVSAGAGRVVASS
jgi:hypothetical protein